MTAYAQVLFDKLIENGIHVVDVWYEFNGPLSRYSAWYFKDREGDEFLLGRSKTLAMAAVINNQFEKMED